MYLEYYELTEAPFSITPDPRFVYLTDQHRDALAHLLFGITQGGGGGFVQLTGEVGTGKTTLCRLLMAQLPENVRTALVLNPIQRPIELLRTICDELHVDVPPAADSIKELIDALTRYLLDAYAAGLRVVVILDEAQNLSIEALEQIRLLTNLETPTQKLLQIILLGQPELRVLLRRDDLRQLTQRITARFHLAPLSADETPSYVRHRLAVAGRRRELFSDAALRELYRQTGGFPRSINVVADRALLGGYARSLPTIDVAMVKAAAREVGGGEGTARNRGSAWIIAGTLLVCAALALVAWPSRRIATTAPTLAAPGRTSLPTTVDIEQLTGFDDPTAAMNVVAGWWNERVSVDGPRCHVASAVALCARLRLNEHLLLNLNRPLVLELRSNEGAAWHAIRRLKRPIAQIAGNQRMADVEWTAVAARWLGDAWLVVERPPSYSGEVLAVGATGAGVDHVHAVLDALDGKSSAESYDANSADRVRSIQQRFGLRPDGLVGPETMAVLTALQPGGPRLNENAAAFVSAPQQ